MNPILILILIWNVALTVFLIYGKFNTKKDKREKDDIDRRVDVLIRVTHSHEQFITSLKKQAEEIRNHRRGAR